jgi:hypothetical protein
MRKNQGVRQPEMPRKPTIVASAMSEPVVKTAGKSGTTEKDRNPIMPKDGPGSISAKLGKALA